MRALIDILTDEKRLVEELNAVDQAIRSTVILFDETYAIPREGDAKERALKRYKDELDMLRERNKHIRNILNEIKTELREYFAELNK